MVYTRKGDGWWRRTDSIDHDAEQIVYNCKDHKVYIATNSSWRVFALDFSDDIPRQNGHLSPLYVGRDSIFNDGYFSRMIATTVSGQVLLVTYMVDQDYRWQFGIYGYDPMTMSWERLDVLGDEALILDMDFTVVSKDIPGMKRNSIYFIGIYIDHQIKDPEHIFVYDLGTRTTERLPQWVVSDR